MPRPIRHKGFFTAEVQGLEAALAEFQRYSTEVQENVKAVIRDTANKITVNAKSKVAIDQGETRDSIEPRIFNQGFSATIGPRLPKGWKAHWIEFGTAPRRQKKTGRYTGEMPAMPFMSPAFEEEKPEYIQRLRKAMGEIR